MRLIEKGADGHWYSPTWFAFIILTGVNFASIYAMQWLSINYLIPWHIASVSNVLKWVLS